MAKRNNDEDKLIKINPIYNSEESLISVAILNALTILKAEENPLVKIPTRKELTKLLKTAKFENAIRALDEVNNIRIRPIPCMEATGPVGIIYIDHPVTGKLPCTIYRNENLSEYQFHLINSGLGDDVVCIDETTFNERLAISDEIQGYQIFLNTGTKTTFKDKELSCDSCNRYSFNDKDEICLYDKEKITDCTICCNKFIDCFSWKQPKGE